MATNKNFDRDFERFKKKNPSWKVYLNESTYFELMDWYDATYGLGSEEADSDEAHDFANYVWDKIHEDEPRLEMLVRESRYGVSGYYELRNMKRDELLSLLTMIKGACLPERQTFNRVKDQIEKVLEL